MAALLERKLSEGLEVRVIVDGLGSRPYRQARAMFTRLAAAGAEIVVNDVLPPDRVGLFPAGRPTWRLGELGRADHRKLYVIDGSVAWTGGAGIEDHFDDGRFHDVMVRVTGDVVRQAQAAFLTSFRGHGGPLPADLSRHFPAPADPGATPIALAQVIPGGFVAASQAVAEQIDAARERLDVMNPYLTDRDAVERLAGGRPARGAGAGRRLPGVEQLRGDRRAEAPLRASWPRRAPSVWEVPGTVVHAKVVVADDVVSFGTVNLDAWALYRNSEILMIARSPEAAARVRERLFDADVARAARGEPPSGTRERLQSRLWDKLSYYL